MERLTIRAYALAGILVLAGLLTLLTPAKVYASRTESWMERQEPEQFGSWSMIHGGSNPHQSYRMDDVTYKTLHPYGIVARVFRDGSKSFDVVLIASQQRGSFHDPRVCFTAQGWNLTSQWSDVLHTRSRGDVPVTIAKMDGPEQNKLTMFFYRGPGGFYATTARLKMGMFIERLKGGSDVDGVFYRIIPAYQGATASDLKAFGAEFLDACNAYSGGYF